MASDQIVGRDAYVAISYSGSTWNVSGDGNRTTLNQPVEAPEKTAYQPPGGTRQRSACGLKDWSLSFDGFFNDTAASSGSTPGIEDVLRLVRGEQVVVDYGPAGSTSGYRKYSGSGVVLNPNVESPVDNMITFSFEVQASSGSLTYTTF